MHDSTQLSKTTSSCKTSTSRSLRRRGGILRTLVAGPVLVFLRFASAIASGASATWNLNPTDSVWQTATNWTPATVPNGPNDIATFGVSNRTAITNDTLHDIEVNGIVFNPGASAFTIAFGNSSFFEDYVISGLGYHEQFRDYTELCDYRLR